LEASPNGKAVVHPVASSDVPVGTEPKPAQATGAVVAPEAAPEAPKRSSATVAVVTPVVRERTSREVVSPKRAPSDSSADSAGPGQTSSESVVALGSGDVLVVSATPGANVYLGEKFIGQTPVRTRLPVGPALLSVQLSPQGPRTPITTHVASGRLNIVSLK